jgi:hypothetical protein
MVGSNPAGIDRDGLGIAWWTGDERTEYIEVPTRGLNGRLGAQGALDQKTHTGPHDAGTQTQRLLSHGALNHLGRNETGRCRPGCTGVSQTSQDVNCSMARAWKGRRG